MIALISIVASMTLMALAGAVAVRIENRSKRGKTPSDGPGSEDGVG